MDRLHRFQEASFSVASSVLQNRPVFHSDCEGRVYYVGQQIRGLLVTHCLTRTHTHKLPGSASRTLFSKVAGCVQTRPEQSRTQHTVTSSVSVKKQTRSSSNLQCFLDPCVPVPALGNDAFSNFLIVPDVISDFLAEFESSC